MYYIFMNASVTYTLFWYEFSFIRSYYLKLNLFIYTLFNSCMIRQLFEYFRLDNDPAE